MAYNYYPQYYQPMQPNAYPTQMNVGQMQPNAQPVVANNATAQTHNGGFVSVPSEDIAMSYPVEPGKCVTFKIEGKPIVMEKSMGFSQLEAPKIERYRLVKEEVSETHKDGQNESQNESVDMKLIISTIDTLKSEIDALWDAVEALRTPPIRKSVKKKEVAEDDSE